MELNDAIMGRRSVREYTAVDEPTMRCLIDAAVQAPSAVNLPPSTFTVVREQSPLDPSAEDANCRSRL